MSATLAEEGGGVTPISSAIDPPGPDEAPSYHEIKSALTNSWARNQAAYGVAVKKYEAPDHLSAEAAEWWARIQAEYAIADNAGLLLLQSAMESFDSMREAQKAVDKHGVTYLDRYQQPKANPACAVVRDSRAQMLAALKQLNLDIEPLRDGPGRPGGS
jgi:P27 family predicted phage terminase small subunit